MNLLLGNHLPLRHVSHPMKRPLLICLATAATAFGAEGRPSPRIFRLLDRDADGKIAPAEVNRSPWVARLDKDKDGTVSGAEFDAGWGEFAELRATLAARFPQAMGYPESKPAAPVLESPRQAAKLLPANESGIGTLIPNAEVVTLEGKTMKLAEVTKDGTKAVVIACVSSSCPVGKRYFPTLAALEKEYAAKGVAFLFVGPTKTDADLRAALDAAGVKAACVRDPQNQLLKALGATASTDCFVLDAKRTLQYRGAIDDQYGLGYSLEAPRTRLLAQALDAVLDRRTPAIVATEAPGCALDLSAAQPAALGGVTFHNRISRLLQQNCQECHRAGGVAPFPLMTPEDVQEHAGMVRKMVEQRLMPPWFAAPPAKGGHSPWSNDRSLSERDRADLLAWLGAGRPLGDAKDAPLPRQWPAGEWLIGTPDAIFQIPQPIQVQASGTMPYQTARVPTNFAETRYVSAIEVLPTARDVVHHVLVFADVNRAGRVQQILRQGALRPQTNEEEGGFLAIYVPGNSTLIYPHGFGKAIPAGATLRFQIHYTPNGKATQDQVRVGMKFCRETPRNVVLNHGIANRRFTIPPNADNHEVTARLQVPAEVKVLAFLPHMHLRGKAWRYEATLPDGTNQTMLDVPRYDFNWQLIYRYAEPLTLPAGTMIQATGWFDNSTGNPANPDPNKPVRWGPQTYEEMMLGYIEYYHPHATRARVEAGAGK
jgi:hypothetical protein